MNGATQTFRRPSLATSLSAASPQREGGGGQTNAPASTPGVYVPPHRNGPIVESRYGKDQLLQLFKGQKETEELNDDLSSLYVAGWEPSAANGAAGAGWGRRDDYGRDAQPTSDVCWEPEGNTHPLGLVDMSEEEKEVCASTSN